ncbi:MAG: ComEC/Rec2 family competence protein [Clostridia bacterium]
MFLLNIYKDKYDKNKEKEDISKIYGEFKYGEKLKLRGKIVIPKKLGNPHEFDYKRYLNSLNVVGCISTYEVVESDAKTSGNNIFLGLSYFLREDIGKKVEEKMPEKEASLFKSMIYGDDRQLDSSIRQDFKNIGISHLLAVSGSNIASVVLITTFLFKRFNKKVVLILNILTVCIFCVISGLEISVIRAGIMTLLTFVFTIFEIKASSYTKIFISFICIFIYNPYAIFNVRMCFILSCNYWNISVFPYYT